MYIDITDFTPSHLQYFMNDNKDNNFVLLYMPYLNYSNMLQLEELAGKQHVKCMNIPITLPVMDIVKQAEHAGVETTSAFVLRIIYSVRKAIVDALNLGA